MLLIRLLHENIKNERIKVMYIAICILKHSNKDILQHCIYTVVVLANFKSRIGIEWIGFQIDAAMNRDVFFNGVQRIVLHLNVCGDSLPSL